MYLSRGKRDADAQQLERLQKQLAKVTLERNEARQELILIKRARKTAGAEAVELAAERLQDIGPNNFESRDVVEWLKAVARGE